MSATSRCTDNDPIYRARGLWVWHAIEGDAVAMAMLIPAGQQRGSRLREQAVRILGRDCRENGRVEYIRTRSQGSPPRRWSISIPCWPMADDPDAGVRRELILALRNLPTDKVGDALRKLAASWDGQDRWYLEALGLALEKRESDTCPSCSTARFTVISVWSEAGKQGQVALPPYFPVDRNEAYIETGTPDLPASASASTSVSRGGFIGAKCCRLLERVIPALRAPELQQAADDILERMNEPETAGTGGRMAIEGQ